MVSTIAIYGAKSTPWTFSSVVLKRKALWIQRLVFWINISLWWCVLFSLKLSLYVHLCPKHRLEKSTEEWYWKLGALWMGWTWWKPSSDVRRVRMLFSNAKDWLTHKKHQCKLMFSLTVFVIIILYLDAGTFQLRNGVLLLSSGFHARVLSAFV